MKPPIRVLIAGVVLALGGLGMATLLALRGHPWFAAAVLAIVCSARLRWSAST